MLTTTFQVAAVAIIAALVAVGASPLQAREPAYGGIGATVAHFNAAHANGRGNPPAGTTYYGLTEHGTVGSRITTWLSAGSRTAARPSFWRG